VTGQRNNGTDDGSAYSAMSNAVFLANHAAVVTPRELQLVAYLATKWSNEVHLKHYND